MKGCPSAPRPRTPAAQRPLARWPWRGNRPAAPRTHPCAMRRHVVLPQDIAKRLPKNRLLSEAEWRGLGVCQVQSARHLRQSCWRRTAAAELARRRAVRPAACTAYPGRPVLRLAHGPKRWPHPPPVTQTCSRAAGCTTPSTGRSRTSCSSAGPRATASRRGSPCSSEPSGHPRRRRWPHTAGVARSRMAPASPRQRHNDGRAAPRSDAAAVRCAGTARDAKAVVASSRAGCRWPPRPRLHVEQA